MKHVLNVELNNGSMLGAVLKHRVYSRRSFIVFGKRKLITEINYYCVNYTPAGAEWIADSQNIHTLRNDDDINWRLSTK